MNPPARGNPSRLIFSLALGLVTVSVASSFQIDRGGTAARAVPRDEEWWMNAHRSILERSRKPVDLLFLGDSITHRWQGNDVWRQFYGGRNAANYGIPGDQTEHLLWRVTHDEVQGIQPKVVVLMIGTNNIGRNTPSEIAEAIKQIVQELRSRLPKSKILVLGVLPRSENQSTEFVKTHDSAKTAIQTVEINGRLARLSDRSMVRYLDLRQNFLDREGLVPKTLMLDFLHLSEQGYRVWAEAMEPVLREMLAG